MNKRAGIILVSIFILVFLAGLFKGVSDTLQFHYAKSIFNQEQYNQSYFNPTLSWKNKYKDYNSGDKSPAFVASIGPLVALTDAWHLAQAIQILAWSLALFLSLFLGTLVLIKRKILFFMTFFLLNYLIFHLGFISAYDWLLILK